MNTCDDCAALPERREDWPHGTMALAATITCADERGDATTESRFQCWECGARWKLLMGSSGSRRQWERLDDVRAAP